MGIEVAASDRMRIVLVLAVMIAVVSISLIARRRRRARASPLATEELAITDITEFDTEPMLHAGEETGVEIAAVERR
ncbi:MAG TPA: hypothetical protein VH143_28830 [Kofleriaceae bacterium]|nr:hypothetical protein [Kofleriaceae bacterium]